MVIVESQQQRRAALFRLLPELVFCREHSRMENSLEAGLTRNQCQDITPLATGTAISGSSLTLETSVLVGGTSGFYRRGCTRSLGLEGQDAL